MASRQAWVFVLIQPHVVPRPIRCVAAPRDHAFQSPGVPNLSSGGTPACLLGLALRAKPMLALREVHLDLRIIAAPGHVVYPLPVAVDIPFDRAALRCGLVILGPS